jgi:glycogen synthase
MKVVMVGSEMVPFSKVGGLGGCERSSACPRIDGRRRASSSVS